MYRIGIDLGGTNIAVGVVDENYQLLAQHSVPTLAQRSAEEVIRDMGDAVETVLAKAGITVADCESIGIGSPGTCDSEKGIVARAYNLGWFDVPICAMLRERFGIPVRLSNDANCAALAETVAGAAIGCKNMVLITLGTGVGGGIIIDGRVVYGAHGAGGEIGHMVLNKEETVPCGCGKYGCAEQYCSATGIVRTAKRHLNRSAYPSVLRDIENLTCKDIFDAGAKGDVVATEILERVYSNLAEFLSDVCCVVDPEVIVVGGGVSKAGQPLLSGIQRHMHKYLFHAIRGVQFALATLGNDAGAYGAFKLILDDQA